MWVVFIFIVVLLYVFVNDNNKNNNVQITNYHVRTRSQSRLISISTPGHSCETKVIGSIPGTGNLHVNVSVSKMLLSIIFILTYSRGSYFPR